MPVFRPWFHGLWLLGIGTLQAVSALVARASMLSIQNAGERVSPILRSIATVTGTPGYQISTVLKDTLGDPSASYIGFGAGGLVWAAILLFTNAKWCRSDRDGEKMVREG